MSRTKIKKFIITVLIFGQLGSPVLVLAQAVPTCDPNTGSSCAAGYIAGIAANTSAQAAITAAVTANQACATAESVIQKTNSSSQAGISGLSMISGSGNLVGQLAVQLAAYMTFYNCRDAVATTLKTIPVVNLFMDNQKQSLLNQVTAVMQTYKSKIDQTNARLLNAEQGFWKTLVFNILIQTTKSVADALVNKLVSNYKINNLKQYIDSTATLMYDNQYLRDNFPDAQSQLMARAILNQPELRSQIQPGIFVAANNALGFAPATLSPSDPQFYQKMAMVGNTSANPYYLQTSYVAGVDQSHAQAIGQAQNMISQSQGYKTPVNCAGSLAQQQQIDLQAKAASDQLANRQALLASLQAAGPAASQSDLAKAQADYNNALIAWNKVPYAVTGTSSVSNIAQGGGNNTEGTMAIVMCEAISSPATLINKGIDQAFNAIGVNMSQYNNNNLPSFITLISNVASQIGSSLIFGGTNAAKGAALVNENVLTNGAVNSVNQTLASNAAANAASAVTFVAVPDPAASVPNSYQLNFSVDNTVITGADHISIVGDGISQTIKSLSGATTVTTAKGGNYTMTVYDVNNNILASSTTTINLNSAASSAIGASSIGSITIIPFSGSVAAGSNISIICSGLSGLQAGAQIVVNVNGYSIPQTIPITNGQCSASVSVTKANNFNSASSNTINAFVGDGTANANQIAGTPDVTATLGVTGTVLGAFTDIPSLEIRGPEPVFSPRG